MGTPGAPIADELEAKLREIEATLRQASDAQWRAVCASEGWPVGLVAFHLALHMERPAGWIEEALAGKPPFDFSFAETDALNAAVAGYGILPSKGFILGALGEPDHGSRRRFMRSRRPILNVVRSSTDSAESANRKSPRSAP
jgi:hypothetical protein